MKQLNIPEQISAVDNWYSNALVYRYGSYEQQRSKFYRCLGEIAEGVQKDDSLKVATGIGRAIWTFAGLCAIAKGPSIHNLASALEYAIGFNQPSVNKHNQLHVLMSISQDAVFMTPKEDGFELYEWITAVNNLMAGFAKMAKSCGLVFDRVVYNGHYALIRTQGEMNELGMFVPKPDDFSGDVLGQPLVNEKLPSGQLTHFYIETGLNAAGAKAFIPYVHTPFASHKVDEVSDKLANALEELLERHIYGDDKWRHLTFERTPKVIITYENGVVTAAYNDDLKFIMNALKQDNAHHETISGLTA